MEKIIISIGTNSEQKIGYLKEVLEEIGIEAEIIPNKVLSDVSDQPLSEEETLIGSVNRARKALAIHQEADCGLGIEVGYHKNKNADFEIFGYATIIDKKGHKVSCCSSKFLLPKFHREKVEENLELCDFLSEFLKEKDSAVDKYLKETLNSRKPFIVESVRNCLLQYIKKEEF